MIAHRIRLRFAIMMPIFLGNMRLGLSIVLVWALFGSVAAVCASELKSFLKSDETLVEASLISEVSAIRPSEPFWVAIRLTMKEEWHVNWINPGDAGLAPTVTWDLPDGFEAGELRWPYPKRFVSSEISIFGYESDVLLLAEITPTASLDSPTTIKAQVDWLACRDVCVPGAADVALELPIERAGTQANSSWSQRFHKTRTALPVVAEGWRFSARLNEDRLSITAIPPKDRDNELKQVVLFPQVQGLIDNNAAQSLIREGHSYILRVERALIGVEPPTRLQGVLVSETGWGPISQKAVQIDVPLD